MYIQTLENGRIVAMMEKYYTDPATGETTEQCTDGFFEFDLDLDSLEHPFDDYLLIDGELVYQERDIHVAERLAAVENEIKEAKEELLDAMLEQVAAQAVADN